MDRFSKGCDIKIDKISYLKHKILWKNSHKKNWNKSNNIAIIQVHQHISSEKETCSSQHQPKIDKNIRSVSAYQNHRHVILGLSNVDKSYYVLKLQKNK